MPIAITDLTPGDRVVLNCPKARGGQTHREAQFEGIFTSIDEAMRKTEIGMLLMGPSTAEFLSTGQAWARFLLQTVSGPTRVLEYPGGGAVRGLPDFAGSTVLTAAFRIEPDGSLREEEGRRIFIERRLRMGQG